MSDRLYRLVLADGTTWAVLASSVAGARVKAEGYFPNEHVQIEQSVNGEPWKLVDAGCDRCKAADTMRGLGTACAVSCGGHDA